jgi:hypothetical protein
MTSSCAKISISCYQLSKWVSSEERMCSNEEVKSNSFSRFARNENESFIKIKVNFLEVSSSSKLCLRDDDTSLYSELISSNSGTIRFNLGDIISGLFVFLGVIWDRRLFTMKDYHENVWLSVVSSKAFTSIFNQIFCDVERHNEC